MADDADRAAVLFAPAMDRAIAAARLPIAAGMPGECDRCGDDSPRLVGGRCAPCRDGRRR